MTKNVPLCYRLLVAILCPVPDWTAQVVAVTSANVFQVTIFGVVYSRYILFFTPPNRVGALQGIFTAMFAVVLLVVGIPAIFAMSLWIASRKTDVGRRGIDDQPSYGTGERLTKTSSREPGSGTWDVWSLYFDSWDEASDDVLQYTVPIAIASSVGGLWLLLLTWQLWRNPLPREPPMLPDDELDLVCTAPGRRPDMINDAPWCPRSRAAVMRFCR